MYRRTEVILKEEGKDIENPRNFPKSQEGTNGRSIRLGCIIEEANDAVSTYWYILIITAKGYNNIVLEGYRFLFTRSLYRAPKLMFPLKIGGLFADGIIRSEIGQKSIEQAVGVITPVMLNAKGQP